MSDLPFEDQRDLIENAKSRDQRLDLIERALDVQAEFRDSPTWRLFQQKIDQEKLDVAAALADASPTDLPAISRLQARAMAVFSMHRWVASLILDGQIAEEEIARQDRQMPSDS